MTAEIAQTIFWYVLSATFASIAITFIWKVGLHIKFDLNEYLRERRKNRQKNMKDFHLVELDGKCFYQHKARKHVTVCANCAEEGKRYYMEYSPPERFHVTDTNPGTASRQSLKCGRCKWLFVFDIDPSNATRVEVDAET